MSKNYYFIVADEANWTMQCCSIIYVRKPSLDVFNWYTKSKNTTMENGIYNILQLQMQMWASRVLIANMQL